jgi:hypothetical protein
MKLKRWQQCEWCELSANWKLVAGPDYERFACASSGHFSKIQRQAELDGRDEATYVYRSDGFAAKREG